jgi:hypothetical protein
VDQVGKTPGRVSLGVGRPTKVSGSLARALVAICLDKEDKAESVEAAPPGRLATWLGCPTSIWRETDLSKSVEVPFNPIITHLRVKVNTPHSFCSFPLVKVPV